MEEIIPREDWVEIIRLYYPAWKRGRPPIEIEIMLRTYLLQCWFSLSDEGVEDAINHMTVASKLLREDDEVVYGDSAYLGLEKREEIKYSPQLSAIEYRISRRPGRLPKVSDNAIDWERHANPLCAARWSIHIGS